MSPRTGSIIVGTLVIALAACATTPSGMNNAPTVAPTVAPDTAALDETSSEPPAPTAGGWWPQSNLEEVQAAQELADAGDPGYTWQTDPSYGDLSLGAELYTRFLEEGLGWEEFVPFWTTGEGYSSLMPRGGHPGFTFLRCAPGRTNPLGPLFKDGDLYQSRCAPTIDDLTYETVSIYVSQPGRLGPGGIWVVDRWELLQSRSSEPGSIWALLHPEFDGLVEQAIPPAEAEVTALLEAFLRARVDGEGAEQFLLREPDQSPFPDYEVPLLYATTGGDPYERFEFERLQGPVWPTGWLEYVVRLFAGTDTVVEQRFLVVRDQEQLGLVNGHVYTYPPTTENGQSVPALYGILDGEVTFTAAPPWRLLWADDPTSMTLNNRQNENVLVTADPLPAGAGCERGPAAADAESLARGIAADPDFETIGTTQVRIAGVDGLQIDLDVVASPRNDVCFWRGFVLEVQGTVEAGYGEFRMRLYLIDYPGESAQVLAIAIIAPEEVFERELEEATPILDSLEIQPA